LVSSRGEECDFGIRIGILEGFGLEHILDSFEENTGVHLENVSNGRREVGDVLSMVV